MFDAVAIEGAFAVTGRNADLFVLQFVFGIRPDDNFVEANQVGR